MLIICACICTCFSCLPALFCCCCFLTLWFCTFDWVWDYLVLIWTVYWILTFGLVKSSLILVLPLPCVFCSRVFTIVIIVMWTQDQNKRTESKSGFWSLYQTWTSLHKSTEKIIKTNAKWGIDWTKLKITPKLTLKTQETNSKLSTKEAPWLTWFLTWHGMMWSCGASAQWTAADPDLRAAVDVTTINATCRLQQVPRYSCHDFHAGSLLHFPKYCFIIVWHFQIKFFIRNVHLLCCITRAPGTSKMGLMLLYRSNFL